MNNNTKKTCFSDRRLNNSIAYLLNNSFFKDNILQSLIEQVKDVVLIKKKPLYLNRLGFIFPKLNKKTTHIVKGDKVYTYALLDILPSFEKSSELVPFHRDKFRHVVQIEDCILDIKNRLPSFLQCKLEKKDVLQAVLQLINYIKEEIIYFGFSTFFEDIGIFYALHNRQGSSFSDWFAGADIFLRPKIKIRRKQNLLAVTPLKKISSPLDPFKEKFFKPLLTESVNREFIISSCDVNKSVDIDEFNINIFKAPYRRANFIIASDGISKIMCKSKGDSYVIELIMHTNHPFNLDNVPLWAKKAFASAALIIGSSNSIPFYTPIELDCPLWRTKTGTVFNGIYLTPSKVYKIPFLYKGVKYIVVNLSILAEEEIKLADNYSKEFLADILMLRNIGHITSFNRKPITFCSSFADDIN